jgi:hypothetical protein
MKTEIKTPFDSRLEALARSVGEEHSLRLGNAIGNVLVIAWEGLESLGTVLTRPFRRKPGSDSKSSRKKSLSPV